MQLRDVNDNDRNNRWPKKEADCSHPNPKEEYYLGSRTGDYVCPDCGKVSWRGEAFRSP
jgi:hypothetical protein